MKLTRYPFVTLIIIISIILTTIVGCSAKQDNNNSLVEEDINLTDSTIDVEVQNQDILTLLELKNLLETSSTIEVKNIDNQIIGKISTGEKINKVITDIFAHNAIDDYQYSSDENVIAIINFYPSGNEPIYGLVKEKFIYIEGYYFTTKNNSIKKIIEYFEANTEEEPIVFDQ